MSDGTGDREETTLDLLRRAEGGDRSAVDRLFARHLAPLTRWASGRLPHWARERMDTDDLVQQTLMGTYANLKGFTPEFSGAFQAYVRQAIRNRIREELRRARRHPQKGELSDSLRTCEPSPLEQAVGRENLERYEEALQKLGEEARAAVILRVELGFGYREIAAELGKPTANAARMAVKRALLRLVEEMEDAS